MHLKISLISYFILISIKIFALYPEVSTENNDILYKQIQTDLVENGKRIIEKKDILPVQIYRYHIKEGDSIFTVSSRFNITYDTIATLNAIENQLFFTSKEYIYIPNCQGLYLETNTDNSGNKIRLNDKTLFFFPNKSFTGKQRLNFLITPFKSPLKSMTITSGFGNRENPFTHVNEFHRGLDLKASVGTNVYSPYKGVINNIGYSDFYGNYLIIVHTSGYSSHYYHLDNIEANVGDTVKQGEFVATTGNSGRSTGPHLHFEIHINNEAIDPRTLLGNV